VNIIYLLQTTLATLAVTSLFVAATGIFVGWRFATGWAYVWDLVLFGLCGMMFAVAMLGGVVCLIDGAITAIGLHSPFLICGGATSACASHQTLQDIVTRLILSAAALSGAGGAMALKLAGDGERRHSHQAH
jgi:hypothetical protein